MEHFSRTITNNPQEVSVGQQANQLLQAPKHKPQVTAGRNLTNPPKLQVTAARNTTNSTRARVSWIVVGDTGKGTFDWVEVAYRPAGVLTWKTTMFVYTNKASAKLAGWVGSVVLINLQRGTHVLRVTPGVGDRTTKLARTLVAYEQSILLT